MIVVTGMHRSGTSAVCRLLAELGLDFGPDTAWLPPDRWNPRGYFEDRSVFAINQAIVTGMPRLTRLWEIPFEHRTGLQKLAMSAAKARYLAMPSRRRLEARSRGYSAPIHRLAETLAGRTVKDPRFALLARAWARLGAVDRLLFCFREPQQVAASLRRRESLPRILGERFWRYHNAAFLSLLPELDVPVVLLDFNRLIEPRSGEEEALRLFRFAGRSFSTAAWRRAFARAFEGSLVHERRSAPAASPASRALLAELRATHRLRCGLDGATSEPCGERVTAGDSGRGKAPAGPAPGGP